MLWFKHICHSTSDRDLTEAIFEFGGDAYYVFFNTLEILSKEDAINQPLVTNFDTFFYWFPSISRKKLMKILLFFHKKNRFSVQTTDKKLSIFCPKLLDISRLYKQKVTTDLQSSDNRVTIKKKKKKKKKKEDIYNDSPLKEVVSKKEKKSESFIINGQEIPSNIYWMIYHKWAKKDHEATQRYFFRARKSTNIIKWLNAGKKQGWLNNMCPDEDIKGCFEKWRDHTFGKFEKQSDDSKVLSGLKAVFDG